MRDDTNLQVKRSWRECERHRLNSHVNPTRVYEATLESEVCTLLFLFLKQNIKPY